MQWTAAVPVKVLNEAKSRLGASTALAFALAQDTITALLHAPDVTRVVVATHDPQVTAWARAQGCQIVDDRRTPGLNPAIAAAAGLAPAESGVLAVLADLPSLTPAGVQEVLRLSDDGTPAFVADADGTGTSMWLCGPGHPVVTAFGPQSREAHRALGARDLVALNPQVPLEQARRDVDTDHDLAAAIALGVGPATRAAAGTPVTVVCDSDAQVSVVDDNGMRQELPATALAGLRHVRAGQRLVLCGGRAYLP